MKKLLYDNSKWFLLAFFGIYLSILLAVMVLVVFVDPFFHYHYPERHMYYYLNSNYERYLNDGLLRHFDYDAIIAGTSMSQNSLPSLFDECMGTHSIRTSFSGATFNEVNSNILNGLKYNSDVKVVFRLVDYDFLIVDKDLRQFDDSWSIPDYLYNQNPFDDVKYIYDVTVLQLAASYVYSAIRTRYGGIDSFDSYGRWSDSYEYGRDAVLLQKYGSTDERCFVTPESVKEFSQEDYEIAKGNIEQNLICIARDNPDIEFYYFITPYSIVWWGEQFSDGNIKRSIDAERLLIELTLDEENIHLFSMNDRFDMIVDLDNYKDWKHYGGWINDDMIYALTEGKYEITKENYEDYLNREYDFYMNYSYKF